MSCAVNHNAIQLRHFCLKNFCMLYTILLLTEKRKDPGIPNSLPFKETILKEAETLRQKVTYIALFLS